MDVDSRIYDVLSYIPSDYQRLGLVFVIGTVRACTAKLTYKFACLSFLSTPVGCE